QSFNFFWRGKSMKVAICLFVASVLSAQEMPKNAAALADGPSKSVMVIDPKARGADLAQAFDLLRKNSPTQKIAMRVANAQLTNLTDLTLSSNGTLLFVKVLSSQGSRTLVIPVEQVMELSYSP